MKGAIGRTLLPGSVITSLLFASTGAVLFTGTLTGCSDSATGINVDPPTDTSEFAVRGTSVINGAVWKLNREILIEFTQDLDFSTVSPSTIQIVNTLGVPAIGTFSEAGPRTVRFQPKCPTNDANSDGGLQQGQTYRLTVVAQSTAGIGGGVTVQNTAGERLETGLNVSFTTPTSNDPLILFVDVVAGPPQVRILNESDPEPDSPEDSGVSYVEFGVDTGEVEYFRFNPSVQRGVLPVDPSDPMMERYKVPLNFYSDTDEQFSVVLNFNQPIIASSDNVNTDKIRLQYFNDSQGQWLRVPASVALIANCTATGAAVRVTPTGIVPQGAEMRISLREGFQDLTGDNVQSEQTSFASFSSVLANPDGGVGEMSDGSDEILERFTVGGTLPGSLEDTGIASSQPRANWGNSQSPGALSASFDFDGTGGIGGEFDVLILNGQSVFINTDSDTITGTTGVAQPVINGRLDVRNLTIEQGGRLVFLGPNTATILATGNIDVAGLISINGGDNFGVGSLGTANQPEEGAAGQAGGGRGGVGSVFTSQSTPAGTSGFGAFEVPGTGGGGGETTYSPVGPCALENRRGAGGGGGRLGSPVRYVIDGSANTVPAICQMLVGMDGEPGFPGSQEGTSAVTGTGPANGGRLAPSPFVDSSPNNDFFGTMITASGLQIRGELNRVWAGSGGGGGGDAVTSVSFPRTPFLASNDEKGSGGGGGAGGLLILSIGDINVASSGSITADGGHGGGGENTSFFDRIGGGSGGGSGGHIIMSSAATITIAAESTATATGDFYNDDLGIAIHDKRPVRALGGQGGAGREDRCGSGADGDTNWRADAIPQSAFEGRDDVPPLSMNPLPPTFNWCNQTPGGTLCSGVTEAPEGTAYGAGGDGGPGIIQLHVADPDTQLRFGPTQTTGYATAGVDVTRSMVPPPYGWSNPTDRPDILIPFFSSRSESFSRWIPLGLARLNGDGSTNPVEFVFEGTDPADGSVLRSGTMAQDLAPILPFTVVSAGGGIPSVVASTGTLNVSGGLIADPNDLYKRNALLMREFALRLRGSGNLADVSEFDIVSAEYDTVNDLFSIVVDTQGETFRNVVTGFASNGETIEAEIVPYFFRLLSDGVEDLFPTNTDIKVLFDATIEDPLTGLPSANPQAAFSSRVDLVQMDFDIRNGFAADISVLNDPVAEQGQTDPLTLPIGTETVAWDFIRFKVEFNIAVNGPASAQSARPGLDFVRIPYRF
ncbi:hypothetical protein Poly30_39010 [Planctomycetes bacterium Poly30]|uniref:Uncharacterized protein n=1 Tax=Saltatorellus ferox TaxID=2528018 RepID=A0A518EW98_9BACT|nr:hypothetical protein Poly30_39010 [Planctomycetes bacterium Poly30]